MIKWFVLGGAVLVGGYFFLRSRSASAAPSVMPNFGAGTAAAMPPPKMVTPNRGGLQAQATAALTPYLGPAAAPVVNAFGGALSSTFGAHLTLGERALGFQKEYAAAIKAGAPPAELARIKKKWGFS